MERSVFSLFHPSAPDAQRKSTSRAPVNIRFSYCLIALLSSAFLAFGLYHIHSVSGVTEGGILGLTLLLDHWFRLSPAISGPVLNLLCYALGWKLLGKTFLVYSLVATGGFALTYRICELFPLLWPALAGTPLLAAALGAVFVGVGAGLCVRVGGAPGGDDALAMSVSRCLHIRIAWAYLFFDLIVLALSLSYIPLNRIAYSLLTVALSGQIVGLMQKIPLPDGKRKEKARV